MKALAVLLVVLAVVLSAGSVLLLWALCVTAKRADEQLDRLHDREFPRAVPR